MVYNTIFDVGIIAHMMQYYFLEKINIKIPGLNVMTTIPSVNN